MLFNSYIFIFLFLPLVLLCYFTLNYMGKNRFALCILVLSSLCFYAYFNISYLPIIIISILVNYLLSKILLKNQPDSSISGIVLFTGVIGNLFVLFYFKYFDFFISNINILFKTDFTLKNIVLPLGISFFTFQQISYLIDSKRHKTDNYSFLEYSVFVTFFPQLVAGPIVFHDEIIPQFKDSKNHLFQINNFAPGLYFFIIGLSKKVLLADTLGTVVDWGYSSIDVLTSSDALIVSLCYTFQIYFDFSGYCNMAHGLAQMFNINLPYNFLSPYKALSIPDFWGRWHITLTRFFRNYVYIPLGGNRKGPGKTYRNIMIVFFLSGLWHGANWTFILWGVMHGIANVLTRHFSKQWEKLFPVTQWFLTFSFINITWIFFRSDSIGQAITFLRRIVGMGDTHLSEGLLNCFYLNEFDVLERILHIPSPIHYVPPIYLVLILVFCFHLCLNHKNLYEKGFVPTIGKTILSIMLLTICIFSLSGISTFLYFNF